MFYDLIPILPPLHYSAVDLHHGIHFHFMSFYLRTSSFASNFNASFYDTDSYTINLLGKKEGYN